MNSAYYSLGEAGPTLQEMGSINVFMRKHSVEQLICRQIWHVYLHAVERAVAKMEYPPSIQIFFYAAEIQAEKMSTTIEGLFQTIIDTMS